MSSVSSTDVVGEAPYEMDDLCLKFFLGQCQAQQCPQAHHFAHLAGIENWAAFAGEDLKALQVLYSFPLWFPLNAPQELNFC